MKKCFIICGGPESCGGVKIPSGSFVICADSGYEKALSAGITADLLIGDFDSISLLPGKDKVPEIIKAPAHKDQTDTLLAVMEAVKRNFTDITLAGACLGRTDHLIANLQTLRYISHLGLTGRIRGDNTDAFFLSERKAELTPDKSRYLSVFSVSKECEISIENAAYPLDRYKLSDHFPIGVSNEFTDKPCIITAHKGEAVVLTVKK